MSVFAPFLFFEWSGLSLSLEAWRSCIDLLWKALVLVAWSDVLAIAWSHLLKMCFFRLECLHWLMIEDDCSVLFVA